MSILKENEISHQQAQKVGGGLSSGKELQPTVISRWAEVEAEFRPIEK